MYSDPDSLYGDRRSTLAQMFFNDYNGADKDDIDHTYEQLTKSPRLAFLFVRKMIEKPFPELEDIIATDAKFAYGYANEILHDEFPKGEEALAQNAMYTYYYASVVLDEKFPKGEANLQKDRSVVWRRHYNNRF